MRSRNEIGSTHHGQNADLLLYTVTPRLVVSPMEVRLSRLSMNEERKGPKCEAPLVYECINGNAVLVAHLSD